jgi:ABC-type thiamine transport system ATPase subunit/GNAT superfamily N-acetyltransferase
MPTIKIHRTIPVADTPRVAQISGMFDLPPSQQSEQRWEFNVDLPAEWNVGLIVGPSGAGKTTVARELFGESMVAGWDWPADKSILDGFPAAMGIKDVTEVLSSVGFSSPPAWLRPFHVLSNGEQFRVNMARTLAEMPGLAVVDEFTSVVDRQVAQVGSHAIAKAVRRRGQKFVAVACHYDIIEWLDPDWIFQPHIGRLERRSLQGRPRVALEIYRAGRAAWKVFKPHHYLSAKLHSSSHAFVACLDGRPVAFNSYLHFPHPKVRDIKIGHRLVVLPDYQGLGLGGKFEEWMGQYLHERGYRYHNVTAHPALINYCNRSPRWKLERRGGGHKSDAKKLGGSSRSARAIARKQGQARRYSTFTFEYVPTRKAPC